MNQFNDELRKKEMHSSIRCEPDYSLKKKLLQQEFILFNIFLLFYFPFFFSFLNTLY